MAAQDVFRTLPPEIGAYALVGHYLSSFSLMELQLNTTISKALHLDLLQSIIVCKNIQYRDKQKIIRTLVSISYMLDEEKARYDKLLVTLGDFAIDRNMVAHDLFLADDTGDGLEFVVTKATGKLHFPDIKWSIDDVEAKSDQLLEMRDTLKELQSKLSHADVVKALMSQPAGVINQLTSPSPIANMFLQVGADLAPRQPPSDLGSLLRETIDAKSPETEPEPPEKEEE